MPGLTDVPEAARACRFFRVRVSLTAALVLVDRSSFNIFTTLRKKSLLKSKYQRHQTQMSLPEMWNVAICLFNNVTALDFQGPIVLFGFLSPTSLERRGSTLFDPKIALNLHYLSTTLDPIIPISGPRMNPTDVYSDSKQYDILLVPGGNESVHINWDFEPKHFP